MGEAAAQLNPTEALIAGRELPGKGWSRVAREDALSRLRAMGVPQRS